jgi:hypothetical protein
MEQPDTLNNMNFQELSEKYRFLVNENNRLREENVQLKAKLGIAKSEHPVTKTTSINLAPQSPATIAAIPSVSNTSDSNLKIKLFMSLFKGRDDVYAIRWEKKKKGTSGYSSLCLNQGKTGLCGKGIHVVLKSNIHQKFAIIDQKVVWYGSINFLSYGNAQESIMRIESPNIANELIKSIENR